MSRKPSKKAQIETELTDIRQQMTRVDSLLIVARRIAVDSALDTLRLNKLEQVGINQIGYTGKSIDVVDSLRETIDREFDLESYQSYCLTSDNDGHWYVVPADRREEFSAAVEAISRYWNQDWIDPTATHPQFPEWARPIDGSPSSIEFTSYQIGRSQIGRSS